MMKGPGLFSEIGKKAKDLLTKDYSYDQKLTISTSSASGVGLTSAAVKKGGLYFLDVGTAYKYKNSTVNIKVDTDSHISTALAISDILPSTKAIITFKLPDYNSGKLEVQAFHDHASLSSVVALKQSPVVELSGTVGSPGIAFGAEAGFDTGSGYLTKYSVGFGLKKPDYEASVILADKGDSMRVSYVHHLNENNTMVAEIARRFSTNENTATAGTSHKVDPQTTVKSRLNNYGKFAALIQHELRPKSVLTISGEFDSKTLDRPPKFGLSFALQP